MNKNINYNFFRLEKRISIVLKKLKNKLEIIEPNSNQEDNSLIIPADAIEINCEIAPVYNNKKAIVTIISDDGYLKSVKLLDKLFSKYELQCSVAGITRWIKKSRRKWEEILSRGSIELINHSYDHINMPENSIISKDPIMLEREISDSFSYLKNTFGISSLCFVCPENEMCKKGYEFLRLNRVYAVRKGDRGFNLLSPDFGTKPGEWYNLKTLGIKDPDVDSNVRNNWIDIAIKEKKWLIEMWHNVSIKNDGYYQTILIDDAEAHVKYIKEKSDFGDIWVANFSNATKYLIERQNSFAKVYYYNNKIYIKVLNNLDLDLNIFDHPLTINFDLSQLSVLNKNINNKEYSINICPGMIKEFSLVEETLE